MELQTKLKSIFSNTNTAKKQIGLDELDTTISSEAPAIARFKAHYDPLAQTYDPHITQELIESIDNNYYSSSTDPTLEEIENYGSRGDVESIRRRVKQLDQQNRAVSKRVSELVLEKQPSYQVELQRVIDLQTVNLEAYRQCTSIRRALKFAENGLTRSRLVVVVNNRRKVQLEDAMASLQKIATLQQTVVKLKELIQKEDFYSAIELLRDCQEVVEDYQQYFCISKLRNKLKIIRMNIDEGLDEVLMRTCDSFDNETYTKLQKAFSLQGNTQTTVNQLQMHYTTAIHKRSHRIVLGYVELCSTSTNQTPPDYAALSYIELCKLLTAECLIPCLTDLCKGLWVILRCYHLTTLWHRREAALEAQRQKPDASLSPHQNRLTPDTLTVNKDVTRSPSPAGSISPRNQSDGPGSVSPRNQSEGPGSVSPRNRVARGASSRNSPTKTSEERGMWHDYILGKLTHERSRMWTDVANKVRPILESISLTGFQFEEIIRILALVRRLVQVGEEFSGLSSSDLQEVVRRQINRFFQCFHQKQLERLRMFLENESWELCPVKNNFTILDLVEFRPFRGALTASVSPSQPLLSNGYRSTSPPIPAINTSPRTQEETSSLSSSDTLATGQTSKATRFFETYVSPDTNPFDFPVDTAITEDIMDQDDSDESDHEHGSLERSGSSGGDMDERNGESRRWSGTRRGSNRRRLTGPVLGNTTLEVCRLIGRYMQMLRLLKPIAMEVTYSSCQLFDYYFYAVYHFFAQDDNEFVQRCFTSRLKATLKRISDRLILNESDTNKQQDRIPAPALSPVIDLSSTDSLPCRLVALESLALLTDVLQRSLVPYLKDILPEEKRAFITIFQEQSLPAAKDLRQPAYQSFVLRCLDYDRLVQLMSSVNWSSREMRTSWSPYIDDLAKMLHQFYSRVTDLSRQVPLTPATEGLLWTLFLRLAAAGLVEGFSQPTHCTPEARSLMLLDLQQFVLRAEPLTDIRPIPGKDLVEDFIKAFYVPVHELEFWIRDNKHRYSKKQLSSLIHCIVKERKTRQRILANLTAEADRPPT